MNKISQIQTGSNQENLKRSYQLKDILKQLVSTTSIHGLPKIASTKLCLNRIIWAIFLAISSSFGIFFVYKSIVEYYKYDVITVYEIIKEKESL